MCGIAAAFGEIDAEKCGRMLQRVQHRRPDDTGELALDQAGLGDQRLSIVDVSGGRQPKAAAADPDRVAPAPPEGWALRSDEEAMYHAIWHRHFAGLRPNATLGRFATS